MSAQDWTDDHIEKLKNLWTEGNSASQIARALGGGLSRNAVIGKLSRMGFTGGGTPKRQSQPRPQAPKVVKTLRSAELEAADIIAKMDEPPSFRVSIEDIGYGMCRWPHGDPGNLETFHFCGHRAELASPYCPYHTRRSVSVTSTRAFQKAWGLPVARDAA